MHHYSFVSLVVIAIIIHPYKFKYTSLNTNKINKCRTMRKRNKICRLKKHTVTRARDYSTESYRWSMPTGADKVHVYAYDGARHSSTISTRLGFSNAAATRSLSFNCLFTATKQQHH